MSTMKVSVISPDGVVFEGDCSSLIFTVSDGCFGIQPGFENSFFKLEKGTVKIKNNTDTHSIAVDSGTLLCENNVVTIILS